MALYVDSQRWNLRLNGIAYLIKAFPSLSNINDIILLSSDGYMLTDAEGFSLTPQPTVPIVIEGTTLTTSEDYTLKDLNGYYLTLKESE
jgi:hypothetical protein